MSETTRVPTIATDAMSDREQAIAADLDLCDLGEVLTTGRHRTKFRQHRKQCFAEIRRMNEADGLDKLTDDEILAELS